MPSSSRRLPLASLLALALPLPAQQALSPADLASGTWSTVNGAWFGYEMAVDGDLAVVSAATTSTGPTLSGAAWLYRHDGVGWVQETRLDPSGPDASDEELYGTAVAFDGERIVVGSSEIDAAGVDDCGGAYVFELVGGAWIQTARVVPAAPQANTQYGGALAISDDLLVLVSQKSNTVYIPSLVFERQADGTWLEVDQLASPPPSWVDNTEVRIDGGTIYVSQPWLDSGLGRILTYEQGGSGWVLDQVIEGTEANDYLGRSFDVEGDLLVSASPFAGLFVSAGPPGAVLVLERQGNVWTEVERLTSPNGAGNFGTSVALDGDRFLVGQSSEPNTPAFAGTPTAHVYRRTPTGSSRLLTYDAPPLGDPDSDFGWTVELDGEHALVGAPFADVGFENEGEAFAFEAGALAVDKLRLSLAAGGSQTLALQAGLPSAGLVHVVLGSASGTAPGVVIQGELVPLVFDAYTTLFLGGGPVLGGVGTLDGAGEATAELVAPAGSNPSLAGTVLHHAYVVVDPIGPTVVLASEAEPLELIP